jgi:hypothetical protein
MRAIVNGTTIFPLPVNQRVIIPVEKNNPKVVISDGYHYTKPLELVYHKAPVYYFKVVCAIDDTQLLFGFILMATLYLVGFGTGFFLVKLLSFFPIFYFPFLYYFNRKEFIQIRPV